MPSRSSDPVLSYQFSIDVSADPFIGIPFPIPINGFFSEVSGLDVEWETTEYKSTNFIGWPDSNMVRLRPSFSPIVLRRGITDSEGFWLWHSLLALGAKPLLKAYVMITMYNRSYEPIAFWSVEGAWPSKITGPQIKSDSSDFGIEEMTLVHTGIYRMMATPAFQLIEALVQAMVP
jgi:phage tail-like protein